MPGIRSDHHLIIGNRAHRIVGEVLHEGPPDGRADFALHLTRCARTVFNDHPVTYRPRETFVDAVTAAGVYLRRFRPSAPWSLIGTEVQHGDCRFDMAFERPEVGVVIDELKLGVSRAGETQVAEQVHRYLEAGKDRWGETFLGVRLCTVHAPAESRFYRADRKRAIALSSSDLGPELAVR